MVGGATFLGVVSLSPVTQYLSSPSLSHSLWREMNQQLDELVIKSAGIQNKMIWYTKVQEHTDPLI